MTRLATLIIRLFPGLAAEIARRHPDARHLAEPHSIFDPREGGGFW